MGTPAQASGGRPSRRTKTAAALASAVVAAGVVLAAPATQAAPKVADADLSIAVSHAPSAPFSGTPLVFTLTAHNDGPGPAADVLAALSFDYPFRFTSASRGCQPASPERPSVICALGDVGPSSSVSATVTVTPLASGVYVVPAVVSSETPDPDTADRSTDDTVIVQRGPSQGERWVVGEYPTILGRPADSGAIAYWGGRFTRARGTRRLADVPSGIIASGEYRRNRITEAYQRILARPASPSAVAYWSGQLAGGMSYETLERRLLSSQEWRRRHLPPDIYQVVLGRPPTAQEVDAVQDLMLSGRSFASVILATQHSTEGFDRVIKAFFQRTVGHGPSALYRYYWQSELRRGRTAESLWAQLLVSGEVLARYPATQDDYGYYGNGEPIPLRRYDFRP